MVEQAGQPYQELLVVSIEQAVAAPMASCHFAQGGARVIKIERDTGDFARYYDQAVKGEASYFVWANHGKESLCLDIKSEKDAVLLRKILERADIFIQNLAPGAVRRAGFGSDTLRKLNPRLIICNISGYGEAGSYREMKAYDFLVQCESGLVAVNGAPGHPGRIGVSICDIGASMNAIIGIQKALIMRNKTGKGSEIHVSLFDTAADWMTVPLMHAEYGGKAPEPAGLHHPSIAPYGGFRTFDGEILAISIQNDREWKNLCEQVLEMPSLTLDPRFSSGTCRVRNRKELDDIVTRYFASKVREDLEGSLRAASIAYGAINSVERFARHPQLRRVPVTLPGGDEVELVAPAVQHDFDPPLRHYGRVPKLGEHSEAIWNEFP